jgi:hypothetical protein
MYNIFPVFWVFYVNKIEALNDAFIKTLLQILRNAIHILPSHIDKKKNGSAQHLNGRPSFKQNWIYSTCISGCLHTN